MPRIARRIEVEVIGENVDRLITVEMKSGGQTPTRDKIRRLRSRSINS
jgi:hypothetical protein